MCFHWQDKEAEKLHEAYQNKSIEEIQLRLTDEEKQLALNEKKAIEYHGSLEQCRHGFFAGNILSSNLNISVLKKLLKEKTVG